MLRYFIGDGSPDGGREACEQITKLLLDRPNPTQNPFTFIVRSNCHDDVVWMEEIEEAAQFVSVVDNYSDESNDVRIRQSAAFPYSYGIWLVSMLVAAINPDDLDALGMDAPLCKCAIDGVLGYQTSPQEYQKYFDSMLQAQATKPQEDVVDRIAQRFISAWQRDYQAFATVPRARNIPSVQQYHDAVTDAVRKEADGDVDAQGDGDLETPLRSNGGAVDRGIDDASDRAARQADDDGCCCCC